MSDDEDCNLDDLLPSEKEPSIKIDDRISNKSTNQNTESQDKQSKSNKKGSIRKFFGFSSKKNKDEIESPGKFPYGSFKGSNSFKSN